MCLRKRSDGIPYHELQCTARHIAKRGIGYKMQLEDGWYEISVLPCEPPDTDKDIISSDTI